MIGGKKMEENDLITTIRQKWWQGAIILCLGLAAFFISNQIGSKKIKNNRKAATAALPFLLYFGPGKNANG